MSDSMGLKTQMIYLISSGVGTLEALVDFWQSRSQISRRDQAEIGDSIDCNQQGNRLYRVLQVAWGLIGANMVQAICGLLNGDVVGHSDRCCKARDQKRASVSCPQRHASHLEQFAPSLNHP